MKYDMIQYLNISGYLLCESNCYSCFDYVSSFDFNLYSGFVYGLKGAIGSGNWVASVAISSLRSTTINHDHVLYNNEEIDVDKSISLVCDINEYVRRLISMDYTVEQLIKKAISDNNSLLLEEDVIRCFRFSKERYFRKLSEVGNEIYRIAMATGFLEGKLLFTFPFIGETDTIIIDITKCCYDYLKSNKCTIIIPYDRSLNLRYIVNYEYTFKRSIALSVKKVSRLYLTLHLISDYVNEFIQKIKNVILKKLHSTAMTR